MPLGNTMPFQDGSQLHHTKLTFRDSALTLSLTAGTGLLFLSFAVLATGFAGAWKPRTYDVWLTDHPKRKANIRNMIDYVKCACVCQNKR